MLIAQVEILPPEADSTISVMSQSERPDVTYQVGGWGVMGCAGCSEHRLDGTKIVCGGWLTLYGAATAAVEGRLQLHAVRAVLPRCKQDIGGLDIQKQEIREAVELPLTQARWARCVCWTRWALLSVHRAHCAAPGLGSLSCAWVAERQFPANRCRGTFTLRSASTRRAACCSGGRPARVRGAGVDARTADRAGCAAVHS